MVCSFARLFVCFFFFIYFFLYGVFLVFRLMAQIGYHRYIDVRSNNCAVYSDRGQILQHSA